MAKTVIVTDEDDSGRNERFHDSKSGEDMSRVGFVRQIEAGNYDDYHSRIINGVKTPVSDPDSRESNNLG